MSGFFARLPQGWQAKAVFILGGVLFVSSWGLTYASTPAAWDAGVVSTMFMIGSALSVVLDAAVPDFVIALTAIWLVLSARILGFSATAEIANLTVWVFGPVVFVLSLWSAIARADRLNRPKRDVPPVGPKPAPSGDKPPIKRAA